MRTMTLDIRNPTGLHTRPGTQFVRLAKTFQSDIQIKKNDQSANAKSLVKLLKIGISQGDVIELSTEGVDEEQAMNALKVYIETLED